MPAGIHTGRLRFGFDEEMLMDVRALRRCVLVLSAVIVTASAGERPARAADDRPQKHRRYNGLAADKAARVMTLPEGFHATAFAAEPDVRQPIAMTLDDRGRVWVAEAYSYPQKRKPGTGKDRILIFEDSDGDGRFDKRTVFYEGLNLVSGLEVGFGGVWVGQAPDLLFIPDKNGDDKPDGKPVVLLDGWHYEDTHETLNAFIWGPDGWLYGCHGVFTHSLVGQPGTPAKDRIPINAGLWRYHPTKHTFEVFAQGTSNPWGVDFNDYGQSFLTACVIPHLYHMIQGGRYQRQAGRHFNPYTYDDIKTIADHLHYVGNQWNNPDRARSEEVGGGHAHAGAMIYLGGLWPDRYRGQILMNNIHGERINRDLLERKGSGFVGHHGTDFMLAHDQASQILNFRYGPDGQVYMIDWYDANECHNPDVARHDRSNGRIYKVSYGKTKPVHVDLKKLSNDQLIALQLNRNDWYVRHARRILQERGLGPDGHRKLETIAFGNPDPTRRLRGLWALHVTGGLTEARIRKGLADKNEYVRGWSIQLACESKHPSAELLHQFAVMATTDRSPVVRLYLASAAGRIPFEARWAIMAGLVSHAEDAGDHNLPLMDWYALEPLVPTDMSRALELAMQSRIPLLRGYVLRRIAAIASREAIELLVRRLGKAASAEEQLTFLKSINQALRGRRRVPMPASWPEVAKRLSAGDNAEVQNQTRRLAVTFGDRQAIDETRKLLTNRQTPVEIRKEALASLLRAGDKALPSILRSLIADRALRRDALRGLAAYSDPAASKAILAAYRRFDPNEKRDALNTLASRPVYATALLAAIRNKTVPPTDLTADMIRQLRNLPDTAVRQQVAKLWGVVRETARDKKRLIRKYRRLIAGDGPQPDPQLGRAVFVKTCAQCHQLFRTGGKIGPELTGSNRANLDYLLGNVLDPSAIIAKDYQPVIILTDSGRTVTGIIKQADANSLTLATADETVVVPRDEIEQMKQSTKSMMPDDLWKQLTPHQVRSLVRYVSGRGQVPILATTDNVKLLFNGRDLTGWTGNRALWKVKNGEIVGTSPGLKKNEFLVSDLAVGDFELSLKVRLTPNSGNSGIQFRSLPLPNGEVRGYQADIGAGWWGKLYEEQGRGLLWKQSGESSVKPGDWNEYRIVAVGSRIRTYLNGKLCVDLNDPAGSRRGILALQIHAGGPMNVRFKDLRLTVRPVRQGGSVIENR